MEHDWMTGKDCCCKDNDPWTGRCWVCLNIVDGGLGVCKRCRGCEGTLTTECCGRELTDEEERRIYEVGDLDFKDGRWVNELNYPRLNKEDEHVR